MADEKEPQAEAALEWYAEKARALARYGQKPLRPEAMTAVVTELMLDNGKRAMDEPRCTEMFVDWKDGSPEMQGQLEEALSPFGLHCYDHPDAEGSDMYGFIFSRFPFGELKKGEDYGQDV